MSLACQAGWHLTVLGALMVSLCSKASLDCVKPACIQQVVRFAATSRSSRTSRSCPCAGEEGFQRSELRALTLKAPW